MSGTISKTQNSGHVLAGVKLDPIGVATVKPVKGRFTDIPEL